MAAKLRLVLENPTLPLALRAGLLALIVFWFRYSDPDLWKTLIFLLAFLFLYLNPKTNFSRLIASSTVWLGVVLGAPRLDGPIGFYFNLILGALAFVLLGVKNLILLRRQSAYYLFHLALLVGTTSLFFLGSFSQIFLFIILFFLIREFYFFMVRGSSELINLLAAAESVLLVQTAWVISFFPTSFLVGASLLVLAAFVFHDALLNHLKGTFSKQLAIRDLGVFVVLTGLILLLPVWGFR